MALPFPVDVQTETDGCRGAQCAVRNLLPDELQERAEKSPHLMEYLHIMPIKDVGVPDYYPTITRKLGDLDYRNLIYSVDEELFVHIYPDPSDARDYYVSIEPAMLEDVSQLLITMERRLLDYVEELDVAETDEEKEQVIRNAVDDHCVVIDGTSDDGDEEEEDEEVEEVEEDEDGDVTVGDVELDDDTVGKAEADDQEEKEDKGKGKKSKPQKQKTKKTKKTKTKKKKKKGKGKGGLLRFLTKATPGVAPIEVTASQKTALKYLLIRDKLRMGQLEPVLRDEHIEDISCSGLGQLYIEHKIFNGLKSNISFDTHEVLDDFIVRMAERIKKPVTYRNPIVDATLPDGSRINIVFGADVSRQGSNFTIRKFSETPLSIIDLINFGAVDYTIAAYLSLMAGEGMNIFVSGETASGKTTVLNAITLFVSPDAKIVSIEDTAELQVPHPNWIREVVRGDMSSESGSAVTMFGLLKAALRQRPNLIVIGEIRGEEGAIAFQAMQTGHAVMATFHASSVEKLIQRMTGSPINVPKTYIDNLNVVIIASSVKLPNGKGGRRILSINELVGYDSAADAFSFVEVFRWDSSKDVFEFTGHMNSYLLENKIAPKRGLSPRDKRGIYQELDRRAALFQRLAEQGTTDFYELYKIFSKAQREGLL